MKNNLIISEDEWDEIESFLSGDLPPEGQHALQQKINNDPKYAEKVHYVKLLQAGIREASLEAQLKKIDLKKDDPKIFKLPAGKRYFIAWMSAAAIAVLVVMIVLTNFFKNNQNEIFSTYYHPDSGLITSMSLSGQYNFDIAMIDYKSGKYEKAIKQFSQLQDNARHNDTLNYFIASSYLAEGDAKTSIPFFQKVISDTTSTFYADANWYLGLAYLKIGLKAKAVHHISESDHENKNEILKRIEQ